MVIQKPYKTLNKALIPKKFIHFPSEKLASDTAEKLKENRSCKLLISKLKMTKTIKNGMATLQKFIKKLGLCIFSKKVMLF